MTGVFLAGVVAGFGIAVPVGAIAVLIVTLAARTSYRVGAAAALGAATADGLYALVAVLGGAALASRIAPLAGPLRAGAAVVLIVLAGHIAVSAVRRHGALPAVPAAGVDPRRGGWAWAGDGARAYLGVLALTLLSPTTVVYFAALVLGGTSARAGGGLFVLGAFLASASWQLLLASGGSVLGGLLTGPRGRLITALTSSAVITVLAVRLL